MSVGEGRDGMGKNLDLILPSSLVVVVQESASSDQHAEWSISMPYSYRSTATCVLG